MTSLPIADLTALLFAFTVNGMRTLVAFSMLPMLQESSVPATARMTLALAVVTPVVAAKLGAPPPLQFESWALILLILRETAVGLLIGVGFGALAAALQTAGDIIDHQTGLTFSQNIDVTYGNNVSVTAQFLEKVLFAIMINSGLMLIIVDTLYLSYEVWPVGQALPNFDRLVPLAMAAESARLLPLALLLAGPVLLVLFAVDLGFGMLNRAAPQLNVFQIGLSIKPLVGIVVLSLALPMIVQQALVPMTEFGRFLRALMLAKA
jgi:type III secretion protein T